MHHINNPHPSFRPLATSFQTSGDPVAPCKMVVRAGSVLTTPNKRIFWSKRSSRSKPQPLPCTGQVRSGQVR